MLQGNSVQQRQCLCELFVVWQFSPNPFVGALFPIYVSAGIIRSPAPICQSWSLSQAHDIRFDGRFSPHCQSESTALFSWSSTSAQFWSPQRRAKNSVDVKRAFFISRLSFQLPLKRITPVLERWLMKVVANKIFIMFNGPKYVWNVLEFCSCFHALVYKSCYLKYILMAWFSVISSSLHRSFGVFWGEGGRGGATRILYVELLLLVTRTMWPAIPIFHSPQIHFARE